MKIVIPTYKRAETLKNKTLAFLMRKTMPENIYIFVADKEEKQIYENIIPKYYNKIIIGEKGVNSARNFIMNYFDEGEHIFSIDDDLSGLYEKIDDKNLKEIENLDKFIKNSFKLCVEKNINLWGVYPVENPYFMQNKITTELRYIPAGAYGFINSHNKNLYVELEDKEDFERSIKYYIKDRAVLRFNYICMGTSGYCGAGGMQVERTPERVKQSALYLLKKYPDFCEVNEARKKHFEVKLIDKKKGQFHTINGNLVNIDNILDEILN